MRVSLIMTTYNSQGTFRQSLASALSQDYPDLELVIKDGGSTDGTLDLIREAAAKVNATYGTDVRATRREPSREVPTVNKSQVEGLVGMSFFVQGKRYTFSGFNGRPKRCCELRDARGRTYVCAPAYVLVHISAE